MFVLCYSYVIPYVLRRERVWAVNASPSSSSSREKNFMRLMYVLCYSYLIRCVFT